MHTVFIYALDYSFLVFEIHHTQLEKSTVNITFINVSGAQFHCLTD